MDEYISRRAAREAFENADADVCESYRTEPAIGALG